MTITIDRRVSTSLVVAFLFLVMAGVVVSQTARTAQLDPISAPGRYQIVINPTVRADTFLLDSETGRVWQMTQYTNLEGEPDVWLFKTRIDTKAELEAWSTQQTFKK